MMKNKVSLRTLLQGILLGLLFVSLPAPIWGESAAGRFFLMGDSRIHIKNVHSGQEASVTLINPDGSTNEEGFTRIDEMFGFPTKEKGEHISPRLIFMLDYFSDLVAPGKMIKLESGYRSPNYNATLRNAGGNVARTSEHIDGMALDFSIDGVSGKDLWKIIKDKDCCGVGYYGGASIHLDSARPRFWETATSGVRTGDSDYNRRIYLTTDYDRYQAGDTVRLSLTSVSDFGFGVKRTVALVDSAEGNSTLARAQITAQDDADCFAIPDRKTSHFIYVTLPPNLRAGRYRIRIDFCQRPFEQMPLRTLSNKIEIIGHAS
jgi:uncharacterized protein YcbK (DUF882 family)